MEKEESNQVEEIKKILDSIPKQTLDELMESAMYGQKKGRRLHVKKVLEKFTESIRNY